MANIIQGFAETEGEIKIVTITCLISLSVKTYGFATFLVRGRL